MGHTTDFDRERKKHLRRRTARRLLVLALACAAGFVFYVMRFEIASQGVGVLLSDRLALIFNNTGYPVEIEEAPSQLTGVGSRAVLVSDSSLSVYNAAGHRVISERLVGGRPIARTAGQRLLVFSQGGYEMSIRSGGAVLYSHTFEQPIYSAVLSEDGLCAVSTGADGFQSQVTAFDANYEKLFEWASGGALVSVLATDEKGTLLAVGGAFLDNGTLSSSLRLFELSGGGERWQTTLSDELLLDARLLSDGGLLAVTDRAVHSFSPGGTLRQSFSFDGEPPAAFCFDADGGVWLALGDFDSSHRTRLVRLDERAAERAQCELARQVKSLSPYGGGVIAFTGEWAIRFGGALQQLRMIGTPDAVCADVVGDDIYFATNRQLRRSSIS